MLVQCVICYDLSQVVRVQIEFSTKAGIKGGCIFSQLHVEDQIFRYYYFYGYVKLYLALWYLGRHF